MKKTTSHSTMVVHAGPVRWTLVPFSEKDLLVRSGGEEFFLRLADAHQMIIEPFDTGFKTGLKISLGRWRHNGLLHRGVELDLTLYLTVCLEGEDDEELVFDISANEQETRVIQLDWPTALDARDID